MGVTASITILSVSCSGALCALRVHFRVQATMHAEMHAIDGIIASLPDEEKDTAFHRQRPAFSPFHHAQHLIHTPHVHSTPASGTCTVHAVDVLSSERHGTAEAPIVQIWPLLQRPACMRRCQLYVTCEPCIMCTGALSLLQFDKVTISDPANLAIKGQHCVGRGC